MFFLLINSYGLLILFNFLYNSDPIGSFIKFNSTPLSPTIGLIVFVHMHKHNIFRCFECDRSSNFDLSARILELISASSTVSKLSPLLEGLSMYRDIRSEISQKHNLEVFVLTLNNLDHKKHVFPNLNSWLFPSPVQYVIISATTSGIVAVVRSKY